MRESQRLSIALYTAVFGGYERAAEVFPARLDSDIAVGGVDFFRFTDEESSPPPATQWHTVLTPPRFPGDPIRSARAVKILGHPVLSSYDVTIWVDNRVLLKVPPRELVDRFLPPSADVALPVHSARTNLREEFDAVLSLQFDDPRRVREQRSFYSTQGPALLAQPVSWTAILLRRNNAGVRAFNAFWWEQVLRYSRRDQLSFPYACLAHPELSVARFALDNRESNVHLWQSTADVKRIPGGGKWTPDSVGHEVVDAGGFLRAELKDTLRKRLGALLPRKRR